ncbi:MAG: GPR endopeptidase [Bacilli bacterium]|nr:GPR endopeptidase [Bacilli bacterium]
MKHTVDLQKYNLRTDLTIEKLEQNKITNSKIKKSKYKDIIIETVNINANDGKIIDKKEGLYTTITFNDTTDSDNRKNLEHVLVRELKQYININRDDLVLVVGLGNILSTPDSLGPKVIDKIMVTNHLYELNICDSNYQRVAAIAPSVTGKTGIETFDQIKSIVDKIKPKLVIAIDSLAASSVSRVNKTIQITNTGINPGSGIGNFRKEISYETIKIPVIAIGIPTVVDATSIVFDTLNYMLKKYSFSKNNINNKKYLLTYNNINYLNKDTKIDTKDKQMLLGLVGKLSNEELKKLIYEVLSPIGYNLMVTVKEIDFIIDTFATVLGNSINKIFSS